MNHSDERTKLLHDLFDVSKQCEVRFGGRTELATEFDKRVTDLCESFERVFMHGLKQSHAVRSFTRKVVSRSLPKAFLNGPLISVQDVTFWHFVKCFLNKHELERYHVLKHVHTDVGKGRAWLRSSLNEHSLERYLCNMLDDVQHFRAQFYADHALLRFESSNRQLIEIAKNLSEILFAINIDNIELDHEPKAKVSGPRSPASEPLPIIMNRSGITSDDCNFSGGLLDKSKRRPRKTLRGNLITFQDCSEDVSPRLSSSLKNDSYMDSHSAPNTPLMRNRMHLDLNVSTISPDSPESGFRFSDRKIEPSSCKPLTRCDTEPSGRLRRLADDERSDEELHIMQNPIPQNVLLTPITTDHCCSLIDSFAPAGEEDNEKLSCSSQTVTNSEDAISGEQDNLSLQMSSQDQAQMEFDQRFRQEVELITKKVQNKLIRLELQNETLQKENDSLKAQLKKYIDAVQMLKPDGAQMIDQHAGNRAGLQRKLSIIEQLSQVMSNTKTDDESSAAEATTESTLGDQSPDFSHFEQNEGLNKKAYFRYRDAIEYERKLIQVAEMHGELVEFNDRLHRILMQKDAAIKRLKDELIELRGPLPEGIQSSDDDEMTSIVSDIEPQSLQTQALLLNVPSASARPLINIWIPSAFLVGPQQNQLNTGDSLSGSTSASSSSSSHHVYQVYVRIKDEEWNVYRRYSQFYSLHKYLKKKFPQVALLEFPPKKAIGNKHARVVQERRKKLETYLRNALNIIQVECDLVDKAGLVRHLPFLSEKKAVADSDNERDLDSSDQHSRDIEDQHYFGL